MGERDGRYMHRAYTNRRTNKARRIRYELRYELRLTTYETKRCERVQKKSPLQENCQGKWKSQHDDDGDDDSDDARISMRNASADEGWKGSIWGDTTLRETYKSSSQFPEKAE